MKENVKHCVAVSKKKNAEEEEQKIKEQSLRKKMVKNLRLGELNLSFFLLQDKIDWSRRWEDAIAKIIVDTLWCRRTKAHSCKIPREFWEMPEAGSVSPVPCKGNRLI